MTTYPIPPGRIVSVDIEPGPDVEIIAVTEPNYGDPVTVVPCEGRALTVLLVTTIAVTSGQDSPGIKLDADFALGSAVETYLVGGVGGPGASFPIVDGNDDLIGGFQASPQSIAFRKYAASTPWGRIRSA